MSAAFQWIEIKNAKTFQGESEVPLKAFFLQFDLPGEKVNKLNAKVIEEFKHLLDKCEKMAAAKEIDLLLLTSGKKGNFIAGADIEMFPTLKNSQEAYALSRAGQKLLSRWEDLPFVKVAAIQGTALGGGCEWALACDAILMANDDSTRIGLPEVMLGVIPGMGGCVRLTRKLGIAQSLDMILNAKTLNGERAYRLGMIESVLPKENFEDNAVQWSVKNFPHLKRGEQIAKSPKLGSVGGLVGNLLENNWAGRSFLFRKVESEVRKRTKSQYPAPLQVIELLRSTGLTFGPGKLRGDERERAMEAEAQGFGAAAATAVSKNLVRIFFATERVKKAMPATQPVKQAAVLGAGVMGGGIAQLSADKKIPILMKDIQANSLQLGIQAATRIWKSAVQKKRLTPREAQQKLNLIRPTLQFDGMSGVDFVVEAVIEKLEIKQQVLKDLEKHISKNCIVATNTSSLSVSAMQDVMQNPERFGGMHFFNPVHKMPLVEVIQGDKTSADTVARIYQFSRQLGKTPIVVKDRPGFLVNRLLLPYMNEAVWTLFGGVPVDEIDSALLAFGMPMGPIELIDEVGVDVGEKVSNILFKAFGSRMEPSSLNGKVVEAKRLGKKNGIGFYKYADLSGKGRELDPSIYSILQVKAKPGIATSEEIVDRSILPMINEASRCLEEQVVKTAEEVDLGMIMGTGFPPFRGGLLKYADDRGLKDILKNLQLLEKRFGVRYQPSPVLIKMAESGHTFYGQWPNA